MLAMTIWNEKCWFAYTILYFCIILSDHTVYAYFPTLIPYPFLMILLYCHNCNTVLVLQTEWTTGTEKSWVHFSVERFWASLSITYQSRRIWCLRQCNKYHLAQFNGCKETGWSLPSGLFLKPDFCAIAYLGWLGDGEVAVAVNISTSRNHKRNPSKKPLTPFSASPEWHLPQWVPLEPAGKWVSPKCWKRWPW